jgi:hypothetical protein
MSKNMPIIWHYSWHNLDTKKARGEFWNATFHGKKEETHNTTKNIEERIEEGAELTIKVDIEHPFKR